MAAADTITDVVKWKHINGDLPPREGQMHFVYREFWGGTKNVALINLK